MNWFPLSFAVSIGWGGGRGTKVLGFNILHWSEIFTFVYVNAVYLVEVGSQLSFQETIKLFQFFQLSDLYSALYKNREVLNEFLLKIKSL